MKNTWIKKMNERKDKLVNRQWKFAVKLAGMLGYPSVKAMTEKITATEFLEYWDYFKDEP